MVVVVNPGLRFFLKIMLQYKFSRHLPTPSASGPLQPMPSDRIKIAAVQWHAEPVKHVKDWVQRVEQLFIGASQSHCHIIVFGEYLPLSLLGTIMPDNSGAHTLTDASIQSLLRTLGPVTYRFWTRWMSALSRRYQMVTVAGSGVTIHRGQLVNVTVIFDSQGIQQLWQPKWHVLPDERRWGIGGGPNIVAAPLKPLGLAAIVCNDATYYESFRMVESLDARIVAVPIADPEAKYSVGKARRGCFSRVQDVPMVGVVGATTGNLFGVRLTGKAGIYLPHELTVDGSGVVAESELPVGEGLVTGVVSLRRLEEYRDRHKALYPGPAPDFMEALYLPEEEEQ